MRKFCLLMCAALLVAQNKDPNAIIETFKYVLVPVTVVDKNKNEAHTRPVLERAQVFAVGHDQSFSSSSSSVAGDDTGFPRGSITSVTLAVTADQARQLAEARRTGELDVLLLPPPDVAHP